MGDCKTAGRGGSTSAWPALAAATLAASAILGAGTEETATGPVREVRFEGRSLLPLETLLEVAGIRPGDVLAPGEEEEAFRRLVAYPFIDAVVPAAVLSNADGTVDIVFRIEERRLIGAITWEGNEELAPPDLVEAARAAGVRTGTPWRPAAGEEAAASLLERYHREGLLLATVTPEARPAGAGRMDVAFRIVEGERVHVTDVILEGAGQVPASEALSGLRLQPRRLLGLISPGRYVPEDMEEDLDRLLRTYTDRGYLGARVAFEGLDLDRRLSRAAVRLRVDEGPRFVLREVRIEGSDLFPPELLAREVDIATGEFYSAAEVEAGLRRLYRWYEEHSDALPRIRVRTVFGEGNFVTIVFDVREEELMETGEVTIRGNRRTRDRVVRRHVSLVPGTPFAPTEIERSVERLRRTGYFEAVEVAVGERRDPERPEVRIDDVTISVRERQVVAPLLEAGGGASSGSGEVAYVKLQRANFDLFRLPRSIDDDGAFFGGGQYIDLEVMPGTRESRYSLSFLEPYFFRGDFALSLDASASMLERRRYDEDRIDASIEVRKLLDATGRLSAGLAGIVENVDIGKLEEDAPPDVVAARGTTTVAYPRLDLTFDGRELNPFSGPAGLFARARLDLPGSVTGSEVDFARALGTVIWRLPLVDDRPDYRHVLGARVDVGWAEGFGGDDMPFFDRFFLGGPSSFPGFEYRRVGPHQDDIPVGGRGLVAGVFDYSFPLFWREVRGFALVDWADLEPGFGDISIDRFRLGAGGGLAFRLTVLGQMLPATLYFVHPVLREDDDSPQFFSFTVGFGF